MSVTCSNGHENLDGMTFCEDCGVELTAITNTAPPVYVPDPPVIPVPDPVTVPTLDPVPVQPTAIDATAPIAGLSPVQPLAPEPSPVVSPDPIGAPVSPSSGSRAYLEITSGPFVGRTFEVAEPVCLIGRWDIDSAAFPQIDLTEVDTDAKISRKHARITKDGDRFMLEDLGSLNGTSHAGSARLVPGDQRPLNNGDTVIMGRLFLQFKVT